MSGSTTSRRRWVQFSLRALFVLVTVCAFWLGVEFKWIRQRHEFLTRQDALATAFNEAMIGREISLVKADILPESTKNPAILWLLGEQGLSSLDVLVVVDDRDIDLRRPLSTYDDVAQARRLFPEAQIVAAIIPKSDLKQLGREDVSEEETCR
jgi:hypothetical protein